MEKEKSAKLPFKIGIIGAKGSGKTSFFKVYLKNEKYDKNENSTDDIIEYELNYTFKLQEDNPNLLPEDYEFLKSIKITFFDFPGTNFNKYDEEKKLKKIDELNKNYINELDILYVVFDLTDQKSYIESLFLYKLLI
jgi:GTPase SAR1 family protein